MGDFSCCNSTYVRDAAGVWRYSWGDPVPGGRDLTLSEALVLTGAEPNGHPEGRPTEDELTRALAICGVEEPLVVARPGGGQDLVVGMAAPELHVLAMLTVVDISELAGVSKATIDSYRYRGYLPEPQVVKGRTPLWSRPVVRRWVSTRPGAGWRTDIYGSRSRREPERRLPITPARHAAARRRSATGVDGAGGANAVRVSGPFAPTRPAPAR
jgi:hypothetical protein